MPRPRFVHVIGMSAAILGLVLGGCAVTPIDEPELEPPAAAAPAAPFAPPPAVSAPAPRVSGEAAAPAVLQRAASRWVPVDYADLPGWRNDRTRRWWDVFVKGCINPSPPWLRLCAQAAAFAPADDAAARDWLMQRLQPYRVEAADGGVTGLMTGYFEPQIDASRQRHGRYRVPLYGPPSDLDARKPYWTRRQIDTLPAARAMLRGREIAWLADPLDALLLQVQGSGRLRFVGDGDAAVVRIAYAGHNDQPYLSVGRWLIDQGELPSGSASWPAIRDWARRHPQRVQQMLWANPRVIFFREEPLPDPALGPRGAMGLALTPRRSVAVDPSSVPYGTPLWLDSTEPLSNTPLQRLVLAQDTGSAIRGAVRADYFWGWGEDAEAQAGRMKQALRYWALWPKPGER